jgi:phage terminase small subunit
VARVTEQKKLWAKYYMLHWNAAKAAIEAGYGEDEAKQRGYENAHCPALGQYIAYAVEARNKRIKIDQDYVLRRVVEIDQLDLADILDDDGAVLPVRQWPKAWRTSVSGVDFGKLLKTGGDPVKMIQVIEKIKWPDKARNLELLGRHVAVKAWDKEQKHGDSEVQPMNITFEVAEAKAAVQVTNAQAK